MLLGLIDLAESVSLSILVGSVSIAVYRFQIFSEKFPKIRKT